MALRFIEHGTEEYDQMVDLRMKVLRIPLGLTLTKEELETEKENILLGCFEDEVLVGCCMLVKTEPKTVRLRQMAVLEGVQGKGIGKLLMIYAENVAKEEGNKKIVMHARKTAIGFYEKLGYSLNGEEYLEVGIPHYDMEKGL